MSSVYPDGLDAFTNPTATDYLDSVVVPHAQQHADVNDAVEAIEATLGVNPEGAYATVDARIDDIQTTVVAPITNTGSAVNTVLGLNIDGNLEVNGTGKLKVTDDLTAIDSITFDTTATEAGAVGKVWWNDTDGTLNVGLKGGNVTLQVGQEEVTLVKNADNNGLVEGKVVYFVGSDGANLTVRYALADGDITSTTVFGLMTENATGGAKAFCTTFGLVRDINTIGLTEGAVVYLSPTVAGELTTTKPVAPQHLVQIGYCVRSHAVNGAIFVKVQNGYELGELHDVAVSSEADGDVLQYELATGLWKNSPKLSATTPITYNTTTKTVGFDQTANNTTNDTRYARLAAAQTFTGTQTITGALVASSGSYIGTGAFIGGVRSTVFTSSAATIGMIVRGAASQTANLFEAQSSAASILMKVDSAGQLFAALIGTNNAGMRLQEANGGGVARFVKSTAAFSNPGANQAGIYFRDGTTAGTLKLVVRAGAAGAETTILDNIPQ